MRVSGKEIATSILEEVRTELSGRTPHVCVITIDPTPATESYLRIKTKRAEEAGMRLDVRRFSKEASDEEVLREIQTVDADAIVVQLPLPKTFDTEKIVNGIPLQKDADVLGRAAYECFEMDVMGALLPPVVGAIQEILKRGHVSLAGKNVVIVGNGKLVGKPASIWCQREGAIVTVVTQDTANTAEIFKNAHVIISGAGVPRLITPEVISEGVVLIDAGTSESEGTIVGDIDPACESLASLFTPVPGGVGPIAVACLFKNIASGI